MQRMCVHSGLAWARRIWLRPRRDAAVVAVFARSETSAAEPSVFHGDRDKTVDPWNGDQVIAPSKAGKELYPTITPSRVCGRKFVYTSLPQTEAAAVPQRWVLHGAGSAWSGGTPLGSYTDPRGPDASREMLRFFHERVRSVAIMAG